MDDRPGRDGANAWPAWYAPLGFAVALAMTAVASVLVVSLAETVGVRNPSDAPGVTIALTLLQDVALIGVAVLLAARSGSVHASDFGFRRVSIVAAIKWTAAALIAFYVISSAYAILVDPEGEQDVLEKLGADDSTVLLVVAAILVIAIAPVVEEAFFRGFFYRSLRNRFSTLVAAAIVGLIFGALHYSGPDTLSLLPVLALLGVLFCLLYERTGSLYPAIALHTVNNTVAFAAATGEQSGLTAGLSVAAVAFAAVAVAAGRART